MIHLRAASKVDDASLYDHCDRCGKRFASKQGLRHHIMVVHEGVKITTTCGTCGLTFDSQTKLQNHKVERERESSSGFSRAPMVSLISFRDF